MSKPSTPAAVIVDPDTVARMERGAAQAGLSPEDNVAELVGYEEDGDLIDPSDIEDLERQWAEVEAGGELIPHEDVLRWLKTWGTPDFKPWSKSR